MATKKDTRRDAWNYDYIGMPELKKDEWIYRCKAGVDTESSFMRLIYAVFSHRLHHIFRGEGFSD